jgi:hypothetical protein
VSVASREIKIPRLAQEIPVGSLVVNLLQDKGLSLSNRPTKFTVPNSGFQERYDDKEVFGFHVGRNSACGRSVRQSVSKRLTHSIH